MGQMEVFWALTEGIESVAAVPLPVCSVWHCSGILIDLKPATERLHVSCACSTHTP